ncbi:MAG: DJ-1/PfpI family protein [Acidobacteriota bacterium]
MSRLSSLALCVLLVAGALAAQDAAPPNLESSSPAAERPALVALFVVVDGVYNSELMAPYDIFHHSIFRDDDPYIRPAVVSPDGDPVTTFEGLVVHAHHSFADAPTPDILVIPSTDGSMDRDLADEEYMGWLHRAVDRARWIVTVCDGAFPLAATGVLDGRHATTFPGDRAAFAERFPKVHMRDDVRLVVDGKYITSVGGAMSYEPALWLVEHLYGAEHARRTAEGMVWPWDLSTLPHAVRGPADASAP